MSGPLVSGPLISGPQVLIAAGCPQITVTRYRCLHLQEQLAANGVQAAVAEWYDLDHIDPQQPLPEQALVLQRVAMTPAVSRLIERMNAAGRPVIFDVDDLIFEPQLAPWHRGVANLSPAEQTLYIEGVRRYAATLQRCDHVLTTSPLLAELASRHGPQAHLLRNALGTEMLNWCEELYQVRQAQRRQDGGDKVGSGDKVVIGYGSGTSTHDVDFAEAAAAVLDVMTRYPQVELWIAGPMRLPAELAQFGPRVRRFPLQDWRDWLQLASKMDIALAPLEMGNIFCRAKSEIKFVEAGALGIPCVASAIDPFLAAITHAENGLLAANPAQWMNALDSLVADADLRRRLGDNARTSVHAHYSLPARTREVGQLLPRLLEPLARKMEPMEENLPVTLPVTLPATLPAELPAPLAEARRADSTPLTIHWLVSEPFTGSGGHTTIFRMVRHLVELGHVCHVHVIPTNFMQGYTPAQIKHFVDEQFMVTQAIFHLWDGTIGAADATIATYWKTVPLLQKLPLPGRGYYLVQDFEPFFYPVGTEYVQAENTYRSGLHCLTIGPWLTRLLRRQYGAEADYFDFAVDTEIYSPLNVPRPSHPRIAFYARPSTPRRAYELGVEALKLVAERSPNVEIVFYGAQSLPQPPFRVTNAGLVNPWELAKLFSSCDIGLVFSTTNPSLVPLEMMACRCAVVDLASERVEGLLEDGVNCRLAQPTPASIADTLLELVWDKSGREKIVETAYQQVKDLSWRRSAQQLEAILLRHAPPPQGRVAWQAASGDDIDMLAWQIHQLLDAGGDNVALVDALRGALYRTLAEKAALVQHVQQVEERYGAARQMQTAGSAGAALQPLTDRLLAGVPAWMLGHALLSKLPLEGGTLCQAFSADRSHLRRIELRFAPQRPVHTGSISVSLYEGGVDGRLVASEVLRVAELPLDAPCAVDFPPEVQSYGVRYVLCVAAAETTQQSPAIWHFVQAQLAQASLSRGPGGGGGQSLGSQPLGSQPLHGQLAIQPLYGEHAPLLSPRQGPAVWEGAAVRLAPSVGRELMGRRGRSLAQLAGKARSALQQRGVAGLGREVLNYIEWQINGRGQSS